MPFTWYIYEWVSGRCKPVKFSQIFRRHDYGAKLYRFLRKKYSLPTFALCLATFFIKYLILKSSLDVGCCTFAQIIIAFNLISWLFVESYFNCWYVHIWILIYNKSCSRKCLDVSDLKYPHWSFLVDRVVRFCNIFSLAVAQEFCQYRPISLLSSWLSILSFWWHPIQSSIDFYIGLYGNGLTGPDICKANPPVFLNLKELYVLQVPIVDVKNIELSHWD